MTTQAEWGHIPERTIGRRLRDAREDTGMSQSEFAEATGISRRTISRCEQETNPAAIKRPTLLAWAMATNVPLIWIQTGIVPQPGDGASVTHRRNAPSTAFGRVVPFRPSSTSRAA
jgi:transcriptional regulator with XRE-family HTH domain